MTTRTVRGTITQGFQTLYNVGLPLHEPERIILDNGNITQNFRVVDFQIFPNMRHQSGNIGFWNNATNNNDVLVVTLGLNEEAVKYYGEFSRSGQIGWFTAEGEMSATNHITHLDQGNLVVQDLWIGYYATDFGTGGAEEVPVDFNYTITLEPIRTSEAQGVLSIVRESEHRV